MIPLRDSARRRSFPLVTVMIIAVNVAVFVYQLTLPPPVLQEVLFTYGVVPARLFYALSAGTVISLVTATFMHGGWMHLIGNMLYLWVFGDNIEDTLGHKRFLFVYLILGTASSLSHALVNPASTAPLIGASGAIAGIIGAYFILYPRSRILTLVPIFFFFTLVEIPAVFFLLVWFVLQFLNAFFNVLSPGISTVAWWAHIGGFIGGIAIGLVWRRRRVRRYY